MSGEARLWTEVADALGVLFVKVLDTDPPRPARQLDLVRRLTRTTKRPHSGKGGGALSCLQLDHVRILRRVIETYEVYAWCGSCGELGSLVMLRTHNAGSAHEYDNPGRFRPGCRCHGAEPVDRFGHPLRP